ncbi:MAG: ferrous iron transport protein B [Oscillospiraceae bacterium]|nr:ferrous iron transport protein B [Oscillospiraceae bacterium]
MDAKETKKTEQPLGRLAPGQSGIIIHTGCRHGPIRRRLVDMGLTPGTLVSVRKIAPLGDPIEVNLRGYELTLRKEDADRIIVCPPGLSEKIGKSASKKVSMIQRVPEEDLLRKMREDHGHEKEIHGKVPYYASHDSRQMKIALVGNPNSGKTTLFNALTGSNQYVGNWPGVTVEKKEGKTKIEGKMVTVADLPGIYSLSPYSMEEIVARNFIIEEQPDAIINIVDGTNIERNLYLTIQLLELELPTILAINFMDEVEKRGDVIDYEALSKKLGIPVVPISARDGANLPQLLQLTHHQMHMGVTLEPDDLYDAYTHEIHHRMGELVHDYAYAAHLPAHWASIKLLEGDALVEKALHLNEATARSVREIAEEYEASSALGDRETLIADSRYQFIEQAISESVHRGSKKDAVSFSFQIDSIVTHKFLAIPIFLLMMLLVFSVTFGPVGSFLSNIVDVLINGKFSLLMDHLLTASGVSPWVNSLVTDGIIRGVGGVLTFLPQIALLFLFLSLLEDSGYMSRAAFIMDRLLRRFGLSGKAFIPMLMGFGCTVPAIMGARTMENEKDRRMTILLVPFMSCSARLPVYGVISAAFFPAYQGLVVFSLYLLGLIMAVCSGLLFKKTLNRGMPAPFVLELPPYRMPTAKNTLLHVWERVRGFLARAGTLILSMSIVLWFLQTFNTQLQMVSDNSFSILGVIGSHIAPLLAPLGFGTWQAAVALLTGLVAKEAVISSMSLFYGFSTLDGNVSIAHALSATFTPLSAYSFLVFILLYIPCVAAVATLSREMNSAKWTLFSICWQLFTAYTVSFLIFQGGRLLGLG